MKMCFIATFKHSQHAKVNRVRIPVSTSHFSPWYPWDSPVLTHFSSPYPALPGDSRGLKQFQLLL